VPAPPESHRAAALAAGLRGLPVVVESVEVVVSEVFVPSYPDGPRPTSTVTLRGRGEHGRGEHVGWTRSAHEEFERRALGRTPVGASTVGALSQELAQTVGAAYDRAAFEAAAIDLALRQAGTTLGGLVGAAPRDTRYVVSFAPDGDPLDALARAVGDASGVEVKIDVGPEWSDATFEALAATGRVAVLDWKGRGDPTRHEAAHRLLPEALLEDPGPDPRSASPAVASRRSVDAPLTRADALDRLGAPFAANVKPARMGGVLEALDAVARCAERGIQVYFGGMFELGCGRRQLLALASLLAPDGPNDVAPIARGVEAAPRPPRLVPCPSVGFAA
jgi:L-alanine-DL-glutamate epimerase-like enolase superfamily enzyme